MSAVLPPTDARWTVRSRATSSKSSHQVTIPAAVAKQLPSHVAWECSVTEDGLLFRYLGPIETKQEPPRVSVPWVDA